MDVINREEFPTSRAVIKIDHARCDGCAICIESCPTQALRVIPNRDRPGKKIVSVAPKLCEGCGVCQATCPKEAIFLPGLSAEDLRGFIEQALSMRGPKP
ncbi:MAG: 4Fe-4S dicluster domain-containing protein [Desulfovibrionales bacterium]